MRGDFRQTSLADVLRLLYVERENGVLHVSVSDAEKRIHLANGVPVYCAAGNPSLTRDESRGLLYPLFAQRSGEFAFEKLDLPIDEELALEESLPETILAGSRSIEDIETLEELVGGHDSVFACSPTAVLPVFNVKLTEMERTLLAFARERERFELKDAELGADELESLRALNALLSLGLLELMEQKTPSSSRASESGDPSPSEAEDIAKAMTQASTEGANEPTSYDAAAAQDPNPADVEALLDAYEKTVAASSAKPPKVKKPSRLKAPRFLLTEKLPTSRRARRTLALAFVVTVVAAAALWLVAAPGGGNILEDLRSAFVSTQDSAR